MNLAKSDAVYVERARHFVNTLCNALDLSEWGTYRLIDNQSIRKYLFFIIILSCTVYAVRAIAFIFEFAASGANYTYLHLGLFINAKASMMMLNVIANLKCNQMRVDWRAVNWIRDFVLEPIEVESERK